MKSLKKQRNRIFWNVEIYIQNTAQSYFQIDRLRRLDAVIVAGDLGLHEHQLSEKKVYERYCRQHRQADKHHSAGHPLCHDVQLKPL